MQCNSMQCDTILLNYCKALGIKCQKRKKQSPGAYPKKHITHSFDLVCLGMSRFLIECHEKNLQDVENISVWFLAVSESYLGLVFVTRFIYTNGREALRRVALVYDQVEPLPLHQKKENSSTDTANHAPTKHALKHSTKQDKESKGHKEQHYKRLLTQCAAVF